MSVEQKPIPPADLSLKFMSWSVKEGTEAHKESNRLFDQKMTEHINQSRETNRLLKELVTVLSNKNSSPF
jgi:hypothetical protein